jgi:hypothetical protein
MSRLMLGVVRATARLVATKGIAWFLALLVVLVTEMPGHAGMVYLSGSGAELELWNSANGAAKFIGTTRAGTTTVVMTDLAMTPNGTLYGVDAVSRLYQIDTQNANSQLIGACRFPLNALTSRAGDNATLIGAGGQQVYTVNTATGVATSLPSALGTDLFSSGDLAFDAGRLYLSARKSGNPNDSLLSIDQATGAGTVIGVMGPLRFDGLVTVNGTMFGFADKQAYTVNPNTGATASIFAALGFSVTGATTAVPEPPSIVGAGVAVVMGVGYWRRRRRRAPPERDNTALTQHRVGPNPILATRAPAINGTRSLCMLLHQRFATGHVNLVVGGNQSESHWQVAERVGGQE